MKDNSRSSRCQVVVLVTGYTKWWFQTIYFFLNTLLVTKIWPFSWDSSGSVVEHQNKECNTNYKEEGFLLVLRVTMRLSTWKIINLHIIKYKFSVKERISAGCSNILCVLFLLFFSRSVQKALIFILYLRMTGFFYSIGWNTHSSYSYC